MKTAFVMIGFLAAPAWAESPRLPNEIEWPAPTAPAEYSCTVPQDEIRTRVYMALRFLKQGSDEKAEHVLQLLLDELGR